VVSKPLPSATLGAVSRQNVPTVRLRHVTSSRHLAVAFQLGVNTLDGCEAVVHATRQFTSKMTVDDVVVKLDFTNAFNCVRRDVMLQTKADELPSVLIKILPPRLRYWNQAMFRCATGRSTGISSVLSDHSTAPAFTVQRVDSSVYGRSDSGGGGGVYLQKLPTLPPLMAKTQGFYKVVRASAVTHRKLQISKVVTPPIPD
jgi:hypothetical protein